MQVTWVQSLGQEDPLERAWQSMPVFSPGESRGQKGLVGYCPRVKKSWTRLKHLGTHVCNLLCDYNTISSSFPLLLDLRCASSLGYCELSCKAALIVLVFLTGVCARVSCVFRLGMDLLAHDFSLEGRLCRGLSWP